MDDLTTRVQAGIEWLDRYASGWRRHIDVDRIDLSSTRDCPLGQLGLWDVDGESREPLDEYGFNINGMEAAADDNASETDAFTELTLEWKRQLRAG